LNFYKRVHPGGFGWKKIAAKLPEVKSDKGYGVLFLDWGLGVVLLYSFLFGIGKIILGDYLYGFIYIIVGLICGSIILKHVSYLGWGEKFEN
jgi:Na+/proline symporter